MGHFPPCNLVVCARLTTLKARLLECGLIVAQIEPFDYDVFRLPKPVSAEYAGTLTLRKIGRKPAAPPNAASSTSK